MWVSVITRFNCFECIVQHSSSCFLLVTLPFSKRTQFPLQYLLSVPEGYARLALEHKLRPGRNLKAAFVNQLDCNGVVSS